MRIVTIDRARIFNVWVSRSHATTHGSAVSSGSCYGIEDGIWAYQRKHTRKQLALQTQVVVGYTAASESSGPRHLVL